MLKNNIAECFFGLLMLNKGYKKSAVEYSAMIYMNQLALSLVLRFFHDRKNFDNETYND
jgi:hypothetical protein